MSGKIFLLRHGDCGYPGCYIGSSDLGLTQKGREQIRRVRPRLLDAGITRILCSPLCRCVQTGGILDLGLEVEVDERLREIDFGRWEKKSFRQIVAQWPDRVEKWARNPKDFRFPGGESVAGFISRIQQVQGGLSHGSKQTTLVISHGGVIRLLICLFLSLPFANHLLFQVRKGRVVTLDLFDQGGILTGFNLL